MLPQMFKIRQTLSRPQITDINLKVAQELKQTKINNKIKPGDVIAITGGSRGIANIDKILKETVNYVKDCGGKPIIISAMGSHGGGTAQGQKEILNHLNITEELLECPILASAEVVKLGYTPTHNIPVYCAEEAVKADGIIVINRVKAHTAFRAPRESGLLKMIGIGLGRAPGAEAIHSRGTEEIGQIILELSRVIRAKTNILAGIAIVENGYEETAEILSLLPDEFEEAEEKLLHYSKELMPAIPFKEGDLLIIDEMGKNYSGTGMDTNIIGRWRIHGVEEPREPNFKRIAVLNLTEASQGNANGIGLADFTTKRLVEKIDYHATYLNCLTTGFIQRGMIPITLESDKEIIETALKTLHCSNFKKAKIIWIKNTLFLEELYCSEGLMEEIKEKPHLEIIKGLHEMQFDHNNNLIKG